MFNKSCSSLMKQQSKFIPFITTIIGILDFVTGI